MNYKSVFHSSVILTKAFGCFWDTFGGVRSCFVLNSIEYKIQNLIACNVKSNNFLQTYILFANGYIFVVSHFCLVTD